jgi:beta-lactamase class A
VVGVSLGPSTIGELVSGVTFTRPPAAAIVPPPAPQTDVQLERRLSQAAASLSRGQLSAAVVDLSSGAMASYNADESYPAASLFKVPILLRVIADEQAGRLDPNALLQIREEDWTDGSGVLQARVGDRLTVRELTRLMIQDSDNIAALVLLDAVGADNVNATLDSLGLASTRVVDHRAGDTADHTTSAADMTRLLVLLATGQAIDQQVSEGVLHELERKQHVDWLAQGLPFWVKVAHKWGDLPETRNEAGVIFSPRASFAIAVLTRDGAPDETAAAIGHVTRSVYDYLGTH